MENTNVTNIIIIFTGTVLIVLHVFLMLFNKHVYNLVVCIYAIGFAIVLLAYANNKKDSLTSTEYYMFFYISYFIIILETFSFIIACMYLYDSTRYIGSRY